MPIDETLPNIKTKEKIHPGVKGRNKMRGQMSNQETALISAKARHTGQEHKSYLCPKPLTGGMKQIWQRDEQKCQFSCNSFIHNWVITSFEWLVCWWLLVHFGDLKTWSARYLMEGLIIIKSFGDPFSFRVCVRSELCTSSPDIVTLLVIQWGAGEVLYRVMPWLPGAYPA